ncbi:MAG: ferritin family protein [Gammaproteobacteria bacterium]
MSGEGHHSGRERLQAGKTVGEILEVATEFEKVARDFYVDLAERVSKRIRYLVDDLAAEEQAHYDLFLDLRRNPDARKVISERIETPPSDHKFSDHLHLPKLSEHPDDQEILQFALAREHDAMEQYSSLAETAPEGPIRDLFRYLAHEETLHKQELEKVYYEVVHSGGV